MIRSFYFSISLISALSASQLFGWGANGHRATAEVARRHLSETAQAAVAAILGSESMARAATWADDTRSDPKYDYAKPWHFVEIELGTEATAQKDNILWALAKFEVVLRDKKASAEDKKVALRYFIHFMGDLHQPLHVGNGIDVGANLCYVKYFGKAVNLHSIWDDHMVEGLKLSYTEWTTFVDTATPEQIAQWSTGAYADWANESASIREGLYPLSADAESGPEKPADRTYCKKKGGDRRARIPNNLLPELGYKYDYQFRSTLDAQVLKGGIRLATLLNRIFAK